MGLGEEVGLGVERLAVREEKLGVGEEGLGVGEVGAIGDVGGDGGAPAESSVTPPCSSWASRGRPPQGLGAVPQAPEGQAPVTPLGGGG